MHLATLKSSSPPRYSTGSSNKLKSDFIAEVFLRAWLNFPEQLIYRIHGHGCLCVANRFQLIDVVIYINIEGKLWYLYCECVFKLTSNTHSKATDSVVIEQQFPQYS